MASDRKGIEGYLRRKYGKRTICVRCHLDVYTTDFRCRYCDAVFPNINRVTATLVGLILALAVAMVSAIS